MFIWFGMALVIVGVLIAAAKFADTNSGNVDGNGSPIVKTLAPVSEVDHTAGSPTAPLTLIEYSDFQCPACAAYYPIVERILSEYPDKVRFVYRHFPLPQHKNAKSASYAAVAAGMQGKFFEMYRALFDRQADWSDMGDTSAEFSAYAKTIGLDIAKFETDRASDTAAERVTNDYQGGVRASVNSTPTFFLNGKKLSNPPGYDAFKKIIDDELATLVSTTTAASAE